MNELGVTAARFRSMMLDRAPWKAVKGDLVRYATEAPTFDRLFEHRVREQGDQRFLINDGASIWRTYADVAHDVTQLAGGLAARNIGRGDRIAVLAKNRVDTLLLLLAAARVGAGLVLLNWRLAAKELAVLVDDADPALIIVEPEYRDHVEAAEVIELGAEPRDQGELVTLYREDRRDLGHVPRPAPSDALFYLYTSGTTGVPKAAVLTHDNVLQNMQNFWRAMGTGPDDIAQIAVPLFHVTGLMAQFAHMLQAGGSCVVQPRFATEEFLTAVERYRSTYTCAVPTIFRLLLLHDDVRDRDLSSLRTALFGGSAIAPDTLTALRELAPELELVNTYGATEVSGSCTFHPPELALSHPQAVGYPVPNAEVAVVDEDGRSVPKGDSGEIVVRGPTVADGYWHRDEAPEFALGGWVSGDIAAFDEDGLLTLLDRKKDMINRGGENIFTIELENVLHAHPGVAEAAVTAVPDATFGEEAFAAVVPKAAGAVDEHDLRRHLAERVADFKVPRYLQVTDELPKGGSGKIDRKALKDLAERTADEGDR